jgi:mRNA-degrading endonuclease RelE of RelBE toxin-antitoxin system
MFRASARRALSEELPESVAIAAFAFCVEALASNPQRVGGRLGPPLGDYFSARRGTYRVIYSISEETSQVYVEWIGHRSDAYRPRS